MRYRHIFLSAVAAATLSLAADTSNVVELKEDSFDDFIGNNDLVLAEFFAPWCGHCKALAPEYEEAATILLDKSKGIKLAKVDCTVAADLCQTHGVEGYPTLKVFRGKDNVKPYGGQRKADSIVSYMIKQSLPSVSLLTSDTIEAFKTADKVVLIAYFDADDKGSNETFSAVADSLRDNYLFGATSDSALAKAAGAKAPGLVLYKSFDEPTTLYDGAFTKDAIETFAKTASIPLIGEVGPETYAGYMSAGIPLAYIFVENAEEKEKFSKDLKDLATKHKGKVNFATIDAVAYGAHAGNLNLEQKWPAFAIQETVKNQKFPLITEPKDLTTKVITDFVEEFVAGKLSPSIKSEPIPEKQEGPVHVVVAKNYDEIVLDDKKDVLVEFYAPWCGHCKALAPKYEQLADYYFSNPNYSSKVVIAKVDATANDVPDEIQGFPTIKLYPAGQKNAPVDYTGSRTVEDLAKFIEEKGTHKIAIDIPAPIAADEAETLGKAAPAATESPVSVPVVEDDVVNEMHDEL